MQRSGKRVYVTAMASTTSITQVQSPIKTDRETYLGAVNMVHRSMVRCAVLYLRGDLRNDEQGKAITVQTMNTRTASRTLRSHTECFAATTRTNQINKRTTRKPPFFGGVSIVMQCEKLITSRVCVGSWKQSPVNRFAEERSVTLPRGIG